METKFKVGDLIVAHDDAPYAVTDSTKLCVVVKVLYPGDDYSDIIVYIHYPDGRDVSNFPVLSEHFRLAEEKDLKRFGYSNVPLKPIKSWRINA